MPQPLKKSHLPSLDGLRCFSILYVIVAHVNEYNLNLRNGKIFAIFGGGTFGVQYFFVISGFIITTLLLEEKINTGTISLKHFYLRRILRIFPLVYLFLLVLVVLNAWFHLGTKSIDLIGSCLFFRNVGVSTDWYTAHFWSLSVEEQYYLLFPFILTRGLKPYLAVCFGFIVLYFCNNVFRHFRPGSSLRPVLDVFLNGNFLSILMGSLASILLFSKNKEGRKIAPFLLTFIHLALFGLAFFSFLHPKFFGLASLVSCASIAAAILLLLKYPYGPIHNLLNNKIVVFIGKLSFSLYVWQQLFTARQPWKDSFAYGGSIVLNLVLLGVVAYISYTWYEKPFLKLKERFR